MIYRHIQEIMIRKILVLDNRKITENVGNVMIIIGCFIKILWMNDYSLFLIFLCEGESKCSLQREDNFFPLLLTDQLFGFNNV